ncbi:MAG: hypothetical protein K0R08_1279 [Solimicrobium sp.]|jgi:hypothetical protein|nr:hypothetical protein [Solimicrobium sp.]
MENLKLTIFSKYRGSRVKVLNTNFWRLKKFAIFRKLKRAKPGSSVHFLTNHRYHHQKRKECGHSNRTIAHIPQRKLKPKAQEMLRNASPLCFPISIVAFHGPINVTNPYLNAMPSS